MIETFKGVPYLCATTDIWTRSNRSFIAVTVHFLDLNSFELKTKYIACENFPGHHTHDKVAEKLHSIFDRYGILEKVFFVTTDGAREYEAAFAKFGDNYHSINLLNTDEEDLAWLNTVASTSSASSSAAATDNENETSSNRIPNVDHTELESDSDESDDPNLFMQIEKARMPNEDENEIHSDPNAFVVHELPLSLPLLKYANRIDCGAHKIDKLGSIDALNANNSDYSYAELYTRVFKKLEAIWNLKDSRLSAEIFERITGRKLTRPHRIRWLKTFESVNSSHSSY